MRNIIKQIKEEVSSSSVQKDNTLSNIEKVYKGIKNAGMPILLDDGEKLEQQRP